LFPGPGQEVATIVISGHLQHDLSLQMALLGALVTRAASAGGKRSSIATRRRPSSRRQAICSGERYEHEAELIADTSPSVSIPRAVLVGDQSKQ